MSNSYFSIICYWSRNTECTLELVNNDNDGTWSVESDLNITDYNSLLNYNEDNLKNDSNLNSLSFGGNSTISVPVNTLQNYHFLDPNDQSGQAIPISYEFVVGYDITIDNIR